MRMNRLFLGIAAALLLAAIVPACGKNKAEFGFKGPNDDVYRRIDGILEIPAGSEMMWVYSFHNKQSDRSIGIIYQKHEVVWVDVKTTSARVNAANQAVYGVIDEPRAGSYQLILTDVNDDNRVLAVKEFKIYQNDEEAEED